MKDKMLEKVLASDYIDVKSLSTEEEEVLFEELNSKMVIIYKFVLLFNEYMNSSHNYSEEENLSMLEAHLLTDICDLKNSTVTSLANSWNRSKSATSQTIRKLMEKGLVYRVNSEQDGKIFHLFPTEKGIRISESHKKYDILDIVKTMKTLNHKLSKEEIKTMFKSIEEYANILKK